MNKCLHCGHTPTLADLEVRAIERALERNMDFDKTAKALGISRIVLKRKMHEYGIRRMTPAELVEVLPDKKLKSPRKI